MPDQNALVQSLATPNYTGELTPANMFVDPGGRLLTAQGLPERADIVRRGFSWAIRSAAIACVTAVPTTTAPVTIWNGEGAGGKSYIIDAIGWTCTTSAGAASMFSLLAMVNKTPVSANPATTDTLVINGLSGQTYGGAAGMSHTVTVVDDGWWPIGNVVNSNALTATVGAQIWVPVNGGIVLPPGHLLALACVAVNATAAGKFVVLGHEVTLPASTY